VGTQRPIVSVYDDNDSNNIHLSYGMFKLLTYKQPEYNAAHSLRPSVFSGYKHCDTSGFCRLCWLRFFLVSSLFLNTCEIQNHVTYDNEIT